MRKHDLTNIFDNVDNFYKFYNLWNLWLFRHLLQFWQLTLDSIRKSDIPRYSKQFLLDLLQCDMWWHVYHLFGQKEASRRPQKMQRAEVFKVEVAFEEKSTYITLEDTFLQVSRMDLFVTNRFQTISVREIRARTIPVGRIALPDRPHLWDEQCAGALKWLDLSLLYQWTSRQKLAPKTKPSSSLQPCVL